MDPTVPTSDLFPTVYRSLRRLAGQRMMRERMDHTLTPSDLVHEVYLRLMRDGHGQWANPGHLFSAAAEAMRRILVEHARRKLALRHGGGLARLPLDESMPCAESPESVLGLDAALTRLEKYNPRKARVVMLRHFAGLSVSETAAALGMSPATVKLDWIVARAWLHRELSRRTSL